MNEHCCLQEKGAQTLLSRCREICRDGTGILKVICSSLTSTVGNRLGMKRYPCSDGRCRMFKVIRERRTKESPVHWKDAMTQCIQVSKIGSCSTLQFCGNEGNVARVTLIIAEVPYRLKMWNHRDDDLSDRIGG